MAEMTVPFVMRRAASVIRIRGWYQGGYYDGDRRAAGTPIDECAVCLLGAVNVAVGNEPNDPVGAFRFSSVLNDALRQSTGLAGASAWNDAEGRTVDEVLALLEETARRAELAEAGAR